MLIIPTEEINSTTKGQMGAARARLHVLRNGARVVLIERDDSKT